MSKTFFRSSVVGISSVAGSMLLSVPTSVNAMASRKCYTTFILTHNNNNNNNIFIRT